MAPAPKTQEMGEIEDNPQTASSQSPAAASALGHCLLRPTLCRETRLQSRLSGPSLLLKSPQQT